MKADDKRTSRNDLLSRPQRLGLNLLDESIRRERLDEADLEKVFLQMKPEQDRTISLGSL
jgi:hypothetical protein